jgi:hypothetical protein
LRNMKKTFDNLDKKQTSSKSLLVTPPIKTMNLDGSVGLPLLSNINFFIIIKFFFIIIL